MALKPNPKTSPSKKRLSTQQKEKYEDLIGFNGNPCKICGKPVNFMLKGEENRKEVVHMPCSIYGMSIDEHYAKLQKSIDESKKHENV